MPTTLRGDARSVLPTLPAGAFRCCVTSVPYWMQRQYLPAGHLDTGLEIGRENTYQEYIAALVLVFREVRRTLADDGTIWVNIGDKYAVDPGGASIGGGGSISERHTGFIGLHAHARRLQPGQLDRSALASRARAAGRRVDPPLGDHLGEAERDAQLGRRPADDGA